MRRVAWLLLLIFVFAIPWEYSLDLGEPLGNVARIAGLLTLLAALPALLQTGRLRLPGVLCWVALAVYLWFCCTYFWSVAPAATLDKIRAYFQEMMILWLAWEFVDSPADLRSMLRAAVAGSWILALLTLASLRSLDAAAAAQIRFAAYGQDPNDVARFLDLGFPFAALFTNCERHWPFRLAALGYLPVGLVAVLLTASREGFMAAIVAFAGAGLLLAQSHPRRLAAGLLVLPPAAAAFWFIVPSATLARLATIPSQLLGGDLNQRMNIWSAGWRAFAHSPLLGSGAGSFVAASRLASMDTAHNTALSILVGGGLCALFLASILFVLALRAAFSTRGPLRLALVTSLMVWAVASLAATAEENRATWLLFAIVAVAARLHNEAPEETTICFSSAGHAAPASQPAIHLAEV